MARSIAGFAQCAVGGMSSEFRVCAARTTCGAGIPNQSHPRHLRATMVPQCPMPISPEPYDFFVSYVRADNATGWITRFIEALQEEQRRFTG